MLSPQNIYFTIEVGLNAMFGFYGDFKEVKLKNTVCRIVSPNKIRGGLQLGTKH